MDFFRELKRKHAIQKYISQGQAKQAGKDLEGAYEEYTQAAELGSTYAMVEIGKLYFSGEFRPKEISNVMDLILQGMPVFPWNVQSRKVPDYESALEWFRKAADRGHGVAACMAGSMLCEGTGCRANIPSGLAYLEKAAAEGIQEAQNLIYIYREHPKRTYSSEDYEVLLKQFSEAVMAGQDAAYGLYDQLMGAQPHLLARLGYVLTAAQCGGKQAFGPFRVSKTASGIPLVPVCTKRGGWKTFIHVDLNAFSSEDVYLAFSTDIGAEFVLGYAHRLVRAGTAVYRSPSFGWLPEEKHGALFRIDRTAQLQGEELETLVEQFYLTEEEYAPDHAAFFTECGEKEYSVEIAAISGGMVDVLCRYTIGGSDTVTEYFEPELISLTEE